MTNNKACVAKLGYVGRRPGTRRDSDSWFTPPKYLEAARTVLKGIDLDPFSSDAANLAVKARRYYTESDNAFKKPWLAKSVWMNPPFGKLFRPAVEKFVQEYQRGSFQQGIVLANNATETRAVQLMFRTCSCVAFPDHRLAFNNVDGKRISGNTRGQMFCYFGPDARSFRKTFAQFGSVLSCK